MDRVSPSSLPAVNGSSSFLDELVSLEGVKEPWPEPSSTSGLPPWESTISCQGTWTGLASAPRQPEPLALEHAPAGLTELPFLRLQHEVASYELPDVPALPADIAYQEALQTHIPQPGESHLDRDRTRATQKRFRMRQKVRRRSSHGAFISVPSYMDRFKCHSNCQQSNYLTIFTPANVAARVGQYRLTPGKQHYA